MDIALPKQLRKAAKECYESEDDQHDSSVQEILQIFQNALVVDASTKSKLEWQRSCAILLQEATILLDPHTSNGKILLERVGWELPKVLVYYVRVSKECRILVESLIRCIIEVCNPRETCAILMEALSDHIDTGEFDCCLPPLISGIIIAFSRIQRRFPESVEAAIPILLAVARTAMKPYEVSPDFENVVTSDIEEMAAYHDLQLEILDKMVSFCELLKNRIVSEQIEKQKQLLQRYLGRYILQLLAISEVCIEKNTCTLDRLIQLLDHYACSFHKLLTADLDELIGELNGDDLETREGMTVCEIEKGIALAVYWGLFRSGLSNTATESLGSFKCKDELSKFECLCALRKAKSMLAISLKGLYWDLAEKGIAIINKSLELCTTTVNNDENAIIQETSIHEMLDLLLQVQEVVIHTPEPDFRKHAFLTLKKIIAHAVPDQARLECLYTLIKRCTHQSMVSLLLSCVKDEVARAWPQSKSEASKDQSISSPAIVDTNQKNREENFTPFDAILELLGGVLRPGGVAPQLPDQLDVVLGALNLYRFLFIREETGGTNYTKVLSINQLNKARTEWFMPLCDCLKILYWKYDEFDDDDDSNIMSAVRSIECVLYRCIELIDEFLSRSSS